MCDCFPSTGGGISLPPQCQRRTGDSDYGDNFKQWSNPVLTKSFNPQITEEDVWKQRFAFGKGSRVGVPPCFYYNPPTEDSRFDSTYTRDFNECVFNDPTTRRHRVVDGVRPEAETVFPRAILCPISTETTYSRSFDMPQRNFKQRCQQEIDCEESENQSGIEIRYSTKKIRRPRPKLLKENLIEPGTDTSDCCQCPKPIPCCPCPEDPNPCDACLGTESPCRIHQAATIPTRKYPVDPNIPRYVPDPRIPPRRPKLLCAGGTLECPVQSQFPTQQAIKQAKYRLMDKLEQERCRYPPECQESLYRSSYKTPPLTDVPKYCSRDHQEKARKAQAEYDQKGFPPKCMPYYCLEGGRPAFDHLSTYEADFVWDYNQRFKLLGGEIPCKFEIKPLCYPPPIDASEVIKERTEEKERWGEDWECCPPPAED